MLRRQKHALSQSTTPFACTLCSCDSLGFVAGVLFGSSFLILIGNENSAQSFSDRSFWKSLRVVDVRAFGSWMSALKCLFFQP